MSISRLPEHSHWPALSAEGIEKATEFLDMTAAVSEIPTLPLHEDASCGAVCVPLYCEEDNAVELFRSWTTQNLDLGETVDIIFLVNNREDASPEAKEENAHVLETLTTLAKNTIGAPIQVHVVDRCTEGNALPAGTTIAEIRNVNVSPVIAHAVKTGRTKTILCSDADCVPEPDCLQNLISQVGDRSNTYGIIQRKLVFDPTMPLEQKGKIKSLMMQGRSHDILLEQISGGEWVHMPDVTAGSNTYFTVDAFVGVGGYSPEYPKEEDIDLGEKLENSDATRIDIPGAVIRNTQRISNRVEGDGAQFDTFSRRNYTTTYHSDALHAQARLREWFLQCLLGGSDRSNLKHTVKLQKLFPRASDEVIARLDQAVIAVMEHSTDLELCENVLFILTKALHDPRFQYTVEIDAALEEYANLILLLVGDEPVFQLIHQHEQYCEIDRDPVRVAHRALHRTAEVIGCGMDSDLVRVIEGWADASHTERFHQYAHIFAPAFKYLLNLFYTSEHRNHPDFDTEIAKDAIDRVVLRAIKNEKDKRSLLDHCQSKEAAGIYLAREAFPRVKQMLGIAA